VDENRWLVRRDFRGHTGTVHPYGRYVLSLYDHPKLIDPSEGSLVADWGELRSGGQISSILRSMKPPPFALDHAGRRFAVAEGADIIVVDVS
jgi:hypothetical protein